MFTLPAVAPLGACALITPWNFPMAIPAWKSMPALICGNTVIMKPSPESPLSALSLVEILAEAGVTAGVVNVVTGSSTDVGAALLCGGDCRHGAFYAPTIFGDGHAQMRIAREEIFGPVVALIPCDGFEEAVEIGNSGNDVLPRDG